MILLIIKSNILAIMTSWPSYIIYNFWSIEILYYFNKYYYDVNRFYLPPNITSNNAFLFNKKMFLNIS